MVERGIVVPDELTTAQPSAEPVVLPRRLEAAAVAEALARGSPTERPALLAPRFSVGQHVRTRDAAADHHTRLPAYARGKHGIVAKAHGTHVFADTNAQGLGEQPQWLYTVVFAGQELWGADAAPGLTVTVDAWDSYLEPA
jgi:nitrile hydratase